MGKEDDHQRACSFSATSLQIGNWKLELNDARSSGVTRIVAKIFFKKGRKIAWELGGKYYKKIEIEFQNIAAIRFRFVDLGDGEGAFQILLKSRPEFYKEVNPEANKHTKYERCEDFTTGRQASLHRVHSLRFPLERLKKLQGSLMKADRCLYEELNKVEAAFPDQGDQGVLMLFDDHPCSSSSHFQKRRRVFHAAATADYEQHPPPPPKKFRTSSSSYYSGVATPPHRPPAIYSSLEQLLINSNSNGSIPYTTVPHHHMISCSSTPTTNYSRNLGFESSSSFHPHPTTSLLQTNQALPPPPAAVNNDGFITTSPPPPPPGLACEEEIYKQLEEDINNATTAADDHSTQQQAANEEPITEWISHPPTHDQLPAAAASYYSSQQLTHTNSSTGFLTTAHDIHSPGHELTLEEIFQDHHQQQSQEDATATNDADQRSNPACNESGGLLPDQYAQYPTTTTQPLPAAASSYSSLPQQLTNSITNSNGFPTASSPGFTIEEMCKLLEEEDIPAAADHTTQQPAHDDPIADCWISHPPPATTDHDQPPPAGAGAAAYSSQQELTNTNSTNGFPTNAKSPGYEFTVEELSQDHLQQKEGGLPQNGAQQGQPVDWISYFLG